MGATLTVTESGGHSTSESWICFETALGWTALGFGEEKLRQIHFGYHTRHKLAATLRGAQTGLLSEAEIQNWVRTLRDRLKWFAEGDPQDFSDVPLAIDHLTPFARRIVEACRKIPWGRVLTYSQLAAQAGRLGAARAVGNVMATNRFPLVVPCHRVVGSGGGLGGYSAPGGLVTKRRLLIAEGVL